MAAEAIGAASPVCRRTESQYNRFEDWSGRTCLDCPSNSELSDRSKIFESDQTVGAPRSRLSRNRLRPNRSRTFQFVASFHSAEETARRPNKGCADWPYTGPVALEREDPKSPAA